MKPKHLIITKWEHVKGFYYKQPIKYCNNRKVDFNTFESDFSVDYVKVMKESNAYNNAQFNMQYDSDLWENETIKEDAFNIIHAFELSGKSGSGSSVTPLFPFEIYMLNDGFKMLSFCELNAIDPGLVLIGEKIYDNFIFNPKGISYLRCYKKDNYFINLGFGVKFGKSEINFYFKTNKSHLTFQVNNDENDYEMAINGLLEPLEKRI